MKTLKALLLLAVTGVAGAAATIYLGVMKAVSEGIVDTRRFPEQGFGNDAEKYVQAASVRPWAPA